LGLAGNPGLKPGLFLTLIPRPEGRGFLRRPSLSLRAIEFRFQDLKASRRSGTSVVGSIALRRCFGQLREQLNQAGHFHYSPGRYSAIRRQKTFRISRGQVPGLEPLASRSEAAEKAPGFNPAD
jgi:hypothetical protein